MSFDLGLEEFASMFGTTSDDLPSECRTMIAECDYRYDKPSGELLKKIILHELELIDDVEPAPLDNQVDRFEDIWSTNLHAFSARNHDLDALIPSYYQPPQFVRLNQDYVIPRHPDFFRNVYTVYRIWAFKKFLGDFDAIYEFGCGSCDNLALLGKLYPDKQLYGFDLADSTVRITEKLAEHHKLKIRGGKFDMTKPDRGLQLEPNSAVITVAAMEQIGTHHLGFVKFLLEREPALCLHLEPIAEFYNQNNLVDALAWRLDKKNSFLRGFFPYLKEQEANGRLQMLSARRLAFGDVHDPWSLVVWAPVREPVREPVAARPRLSARVP